MKAFFTEYFSLSSLIVIITPEPPFSNPFTRPSPKLPPKAIVSSSNRDHNSLKVKTAAITHHIEPPSPPGNHQAHPLPLIAPPQHTENQLQRHPSSTTGAPSSHHPSAHPVSTESSTRALNRFLLH
ncbi:hypothetical protein V6N13_127115 [Hibiscus sabdariffa]